MRNKNCASRPARWRRQHARRESSSGAEGRRSRHRRPSLHGCFITGTDTGVGKTVLAAAIVAALRARGTSVKALKPVITGLDERTADTDWPPDHELLARAAGCIGEEVTLFGYGPPVSPHLAAQLNGQPVDLDKLRAGIRAALAAPETLIVEGVGGLLVPISDGYDVRRMALDIGLPILIAARCALGTLNHTLLTLEAAQAGGLEAIGIVLTPWPATPGRVERSNLETLERLGGLPVWTLPRIARPVPRLLAAAARSLPLDRWFG